MSWFYLILASLFEIGWPLGFKLASTYTKYNILFFGVSVISMALSGVFLYLAQKTIPIGTAYVIWTGVGAVGTLLIGIFFFGDSANFWRIFFIAMIIAGIIGYIFYCYDYSRHYRLENSALIYFSNHIIKILEYKWFINSIAYK